MKASVFLTLTLIRYFNVYLLHTYYLDYNGQMSVKQYFVEQHRKYFRQSIVVLSSDHFIKGQRCLTALL